MPLWEGTPALGWAAQRVATCHLLCRQKVLKRSLFLKPSRGVQPSGVSGPQGKKSCLGPPVKHMQHVITHKQSHHVLSKLTILCWPHSQPSWAACGPRLQVRHPWLEDMLVGTRHFSRGQANHTSYPCRGSAEERCAGWDRLTNNHVDAAHPSRPSFLPPVSDRANPRAARAPPCVPFPPLRSPPPGTRLVTNWQRTG